MIGLTESESLPLRISHKKSMEMPLTVVRAGERVVSARRLLTFAGVKSSKKEGLLGQHKDSQVSNTSWAPIFTMRCSVAVKSVHGINIVDQRARLLHHGSPLASLWSYQAYSTRKNAHLLNARIATAAWLPFLCIPLPAANMQEATMTRA